MRIGWPFRSLLSVYLLTQAFLPTSSQAQTGPEIVFRLKTEGYFHQGPFPTNFATVSSWNDTQSVVTLDANNNALTRLQTFKGSASNGTLSMTSEVSGIGDPTNGWESYTSRAWYNAKICVRDGGSLSLSSSTTGSAQYTTDHTQNWSSAGVFGAPYASPNSISVSRGLASDPLSNSATISTGGSAVVNFACGAGTALVPEYPSTLYKCTDLAQTLGAHTTADGQGTSVNVTAEQTTTLSVTRGTDNPTPIAAGPLVSGVPVTSPLPGSTVTFSETSTDPDNNQATTGSSGICSRQWTVVKPNGVSTNYTTSSISFTTLQRGTYSVTLHVTDNEGQVSAVTKTFKVGTKRQPSPGDPDDNGPDAPQSPTKEACPDDSPYPTPPEDDWYETNVSPKNGLTDASFKDPVQTRGYPLANDLTWNSQTNFPGRTTPFGNFTFSYGMEVSSAQITLPDSTVETHVFVIDADGEEIDFGVGGTNPAPGIFSTLTGSSSTGYTLSNAAEPGSASLVGHYTYEFGTNGKLISLTDIAGNVQTVTYNSTSGELEKVTDVSSGREVLFFYDSAPYVKRIVEEGGTTLTHLTYNSAGLVTNVELKDNTSVTVRSAVISYNSNNLIANTTRDGDSATSISYTYDYGGGDIPFGNYTTSTGGSNIDYFSATVPSGYGARVSKTSATAGIINFDLDFDGRLKTLNLPNDAGTGTGYTYTYTYNSEGQVTSVYDGSVTKTFTYNSNGQLTNKSDGTSSTTYTYSGINLTGISDLQGTLITIGYTDSAHPNIPTTFTDAAGNVWSKTLNSFGQETGWIQPTGSSLGDISYSYDESQSSSEYGYLTQVSQGGASTAFSWTPMGDIEAITTSPATNVTHTTSMTYDAAQRLTSITHPDSKAANNIYTGKSLSEVVDEKGGSTNFVYDGPGGQLIGVTEPLSKTLSWELNTDRDVKKFFDARNNMTEYKYRRRGNLYEIRYPDNQYKNFTYDAQNRLNGWSWTSAGSLSTIAYNSRGLVSSVTPNGETARTFNYRSDNLLSDYTDAAGTTTLTYNTLRQVSKVSYNYATKGLSAVQDVEYTYNPDGTRASITWKSGGTTVASWSYTYDQRGNVTQLLNGFSETTNYTYDLENKLQSETFSNGTSADHIYYEPRGWKNGTTYNVGSTPTFSYSLEFDGNNPSVGNITKVTEGNGSVTDYTYDALSRLTAETRTSPSSYAQTYGYDLAGNVTSLGGTTFGTYDAANKLTALPSATVAANGVNGALGSITGTGYQTGYYTYNSYSGGSLTRQAKTSGTSPSAYTSYTYNAFDIRVVAAFKNNSTTALVTTYYIFDGDNLLGEIEGTTPKIAYTWGPIGPVSQRNLSTSTSKWYWYGPQGETRYLVGSSGTTTDSYNYNAYGDIRASTGSTYNPYKYGGSVGYFTDDRTTPIILAKYRWYYPKLMRWLSRDPINYRGGENLFEYVLGNPINWADPEGTNRLRVVIELVSGAKKVMYATRQQISRWLQQGKNVETALGGRKAGKVGEEAWVEIKKHGAHGGRSKLPHIQPKNRKGRRGHLNLSKSGKNFVGCYAALTYIGDMAEEIYNPFFGGDLNEDEIE